MFEKKNEILPFATTWIDFKGIMLDEISQKEREAKTTGSPLYVESKTNKTTKFIDTENRLVVPLVDVG